jgi:hypothetical protein
MPQRSLRRCSSAAAWRRVAGEQHERRVEHVLWIEVGDAGGELRRRALRVDVDLHGLQEHVGLVGAPVAALVDVGYELVGQLAAGDGERAWWSAFDLAYSGEADDVGVVGGHGEPARRHRADRQRQRLLHGPRFDADGEAAAYLAHRGLQVRDALIRRVPRDPGVVELGFHVPGAKPELQATVAEHIGRRGLANEQRGVPKAGVEDVRAQPNASGGHAGGDERREGRRDPEMIGRGDEVKAQRLGTLGGGLQLGPRAARQMPNAEPHAGSEAIACDTPTMMSAVARRPGSGRALLDMPR